MNIDPLPQFWVIIELKRKRKLGFYIKYNHICKTLNKVLSKYIEEQDNSSPRIHHLIIKSTLEDGMVAYALIIA